MPGAMMRANAPCAMLSSISQMIWRGARASPSAVGRSVGSARGGGGSAVARFQAKA